MGDWVLHIRLCAKCGLRTGMMVTGESTNLCGRSVTPGASNRVLFWKPFLLKWVYFWSAAFLFLFVSDLRRFRIERGKSEAARAPGERYEEYSQERSLQPGYVSPDGAHSIDCAEGSSSFVDDSQR